MPETPFPELELDLSGAIADAVLILLRNDEDLETVLETRIYETELERLAVDQAGTYQANTLLVAMGPVTEERIGNDGYTGLFTAIDLILLTPIVNPNSTQRWLRARIFHAIKKALMVEQGTLRDTSNNRLTDALKRFDRLDFNGRLRNDSSVVVTIFRVTFVSDIDEADRSFIT